MLQFRGIKIESSKMDFEKKYHLTQYRGEHILVRWTRGYKDVEVYYKEKLLGKLENAARLKRGVFVESPDLGKVELKLSEKPMTIQVIVDGYHASNNLHHPVKSLKSSSTYFTILAVFSMLGSSFEAYRYSSYPQLATLISSINAVPFVIYVISAIFTKKGKPWAFLLGFITFSFFTLITLLMMINFRDFHIVVILPFIIRLVFQYFLITNLKHAIAVIKHNKFGVRPESQEILDSF